MNKRNLPQSVKASIRKEIRNELECAIRGRLERGSIVSSRGDVARFTIRYRGDGKAIVTVYGIETSNVADATSAVLWNWEYTR